MADEKIINFDKLQEKWDEQEIEKFEGFLNSKMDLVFRGQLTMAEFSKSMRDYQRENNISNDKLIELQKKILSKMGVDLDLNEIDKEIERLEETMKSEDGKSINIRKMAFFDYYSDRIENKEIAQIKLENSKNNLSMIFDSNQIIVFSEKQVDFSDDELNEIIAGYKESVEGSLKITTCEATKIYEYH